MARRRYKMNINHNSEFDLDLAPLLAVMVKLVPVLLVSSAFVQMMIVETELPQVIQEALAQSEKNTKATQVSIYIDKNKGVTLVTLKNGVEKTQQINNDNAQNFNFKEIHNAAIEIKKENPEVFKMDFNPSENVPYKDIVKIMDEVRKSHKTDINFPIKDEKTGEVTNTNYMFPEIIFSNVTEG